MNKEQAEIYVAKSLASKTISKKVQYEFLLFNFICLGTSIALYQGLAFVILVLSMACCNMLFTIICAKRKPHFFKATILIIIQLTVFCIALNCIVFGMYNLAQKFILWEFILTIFIQLIAFATSLILVKRHAEKFKPQENSSKIDVIASSVAGFSCMLALVFCRIFAPSVSVIITLIALLINALVCLMSIGVAAAIYRAYLIKKFNLQILLEQTNRDVAE